MESATFDIVIAGGGLSGLALAAELARPEFSALRVLILEQREHYVRDRTWSYWKASGRAPHRYSHLERKNWNRWRVQMDFGGDRTLSSMVTSESKAESYCSLDGDEFYQAAQSAISQSKHVVLRLGTAVRHIVDGDHPHVETMDGCVIHATWIFDARPPASEKAGALVQQFVGIEITTDIDIFDPTTVELMQFQPTTHGVHFFYVLPYSPRNALIETTWISPDSFKPDFSAELARYIAESLGASTYIVTYEEKGVLNLSMYPNVSPSNKASQVVRLGRAAGTLRASTGYAFLETLDHIEKISASLKNQLGRDALKKWTPILFERRALDAWMDAVFLNVLAHDWYNSPRYFMQLFGRLDAESMVAFLSGRANWRQRLSVFCALPIMPFARQGLSTLLARPSSLSRARH